MGKKKKEHVTFDRMADNRKSVPFPKANQQSHRKVNMGRNTNKK